MKRQITLILTLSLLTLLGACASNGGKTPPAAAAKTESIALFLPEDDADGLERELSQVVPTPQGLVDALIAEEALPEGTTVLAFQQVGDRATLNLSQPYVEALKQSGTAGELMLTYSVVDTFLSYYKLNTLTLQGEGKVIETGHSVYDAPLSFYLPELDDMANAYAAEKQGALQMDEVEFILMDDKERIAELKGKYPDLDLVFPDGYELLNVSEKRETYRLAEDAELRLWDDIYKVATPEDLAAKLEERQEGGILCCFEEENGVITTLYEFFTP